MRQTFSSHGPKLAPSVEPKTVRVKQPSDFIAYPGTGTGYGGDGLDSFSDPEIARWLSRFRQWRSAFQQRIEPNIKRFWALYRAFDDTPAFPPGQEWRDRTIIPECFKIVENRVPRFVMAQLAPRESFAVEGREARDERYEEVVRTLLQTSIDYMGVRSSDGGLIPRCIEALKYRDIIGHVFFEVYWREDRRTIRTKMPDPITGRLTEVELTEDLYKNVDVQWYGITDIALDVSGADRWKIKRIRTSYEALRDENDMYKEQFGEDLYKDLDLLANSTAAPREKMEEPWSTERWPLTDEQQWSDAFETPVELWLCWDNVRGTLTKIGNRRVILDHGIAPTPDRRDPFISLPCVPIPGRVYGESLLHYVGPLASYQTRLARARADEVLLNLFQQVIYREGSVTQTDLFWRPGGGLPITGNIDRPIGDHFQIFPRRPVFTEAWTEEQYRQSQSESTAGVDSVSMGVEATQKSRDVSATEIQQRVAQGNARFQMENIYLEVKWKKPMLEKMFDLLRLHLDQAQIVRITGPDGLEEQMPIDLTKLDQPVDIIVGGGIYEMAKAERSQDINEMTMLAESPIFGPYLKPREILVERLKNRNRKDPHRFVKTDQEVQLERQQQLQQQVNANVQTAVGEQAAASLGQQAGAPVPQVPELPPELGGASGLAGAGGAAPPDAAAATGSTLEEL